LGTFRLICHPGTSAKTVDSIEVHMERTADRLWLRYYVGCDLNALELGELSSAKRTDGLWQHTCFEAFIGGEAYSEFNFSPSSQWAAYDFSGYRAGMHLRELVDTPGIGCDVSETHFALETEFGIGTLKGKVALSAVIEETDGTKSYWALAHPPGAPDFHHPTCFAATLPAPQET
jgi:hypothetical protein